MSQSAVFGSYDVGHMSIKPPRYPIYSSFTIPRISKTVPHISRAGAKPSLSFKLNESHKITACLQICYQHSKPSSIMSSKYTAAHANPDGPGDARPTATQVLRDEGLLSFPNRLSGKTVLITGGTSGLGLQLAKALHRTGAKVFITGRGCDIRGREIAKSIKASADQKIGYDVRFIYTDQSDLHSVKAAASTFLAEADGSLNILICNAGVMSPPMHTKTT